MHGSCAIDDHRRKRPVRSGAPMTAHHTAAHPGRAAARPTGRRTASGRARAAVALR